MRTAAYLILALSIGYLSGFENGDDNIPNGMFDGVINDTLNSILKNLTEPLTIKDLDVSSKTEALFGYLNISDVTVMGLKKLVASKIDLDVMTMKLNMTIDLPDLKANFDYICDLVLGTLIPLYGGGLINANFDVIQLGISAKVDLGNVIQLQNLTLSIYMKQAVFNLNGILNNTELSALFSAILNDNFCNFLDTYTTVISHAISPVVEKIINDILAKKKMSADILEEYNNIREMYY